MLVTTMHNRFDALLKNALREKTHIMADGGMGSMLMSKGLLFGNPPEEWNALPDKQERVREVYRGYLEAGSQIILTNTFGGTPFRLKMHDLDARTHELNQRGAELARAEAGERVVAGSIGPSGELFEPMGKLNHASAVEGFARQAAGLAAGGVDVFWIETMSDLNEVRAAIEGARSAAPYVPIVTTMTFETRGFTMMGVHPAQAMRELSKLDVRAIGANCGNGPDEMEISVALMHQELPEMPIVAKGNAGMPQIVDDRAVYSATPSVMRSYARRFRAFGATIIGACCGSTPAHVAAMAHELGSQPALNAATLSFTAEIPERKTESAARTGRRERRNAI